MFKQILTQFWMQIFATGVAAAVVIRIWREASWSSHVTSLAVLLFGWISVLAADEVADWTGNYGWNRQQWRRRPEWFLRAVGLVAVTLVAARIWWL